jgi:hypothetical protein
MVLNIRYIIIGIQLLVGCAHLEMLPLMSLALFILIPPLMLLLHLRLTSFLSYFSLILLLLIFLFLARFYLLWYYLLGLLLYLPLWFHTTW